MQIKLQHSNNDPSTSVRQVYCMPIWQSTLHVYSCTHDKYYHVTYLNLFIENVYSCIDIVDFFNISVHFNSWVIIRVIHKIAIDIDCLEVWLSSNSFACLERFMSIAIVTTQNVGGKAKGFLGKLSMIYNSIQLGTLIDAVRKLLYNFIRHIKFTRCQRESSVT